MNTQEISEANKYLQKLGYQKDHIYFEQCKGYTSDLLKNLMKSGYYVVKSGALHIAKDAEGHKVTTGYTWEEMLYNLARIMR